MMIEDINLTALLVSRKQKIAQNIYLFELRAEDGRELEPFTAGAHLPIRVPRGMMRQYSLCGDPADRGVYQIAIKLEVDGRGGSASMISDVNVGDSLMVGKPANLFELSDLARSFFLIAGGIGVTPMMAMIKQLKAEQLRPFKLFYFTRDEDSTAFITELDSSEYADSVVIHHNQGDTKKSFDLWTIFEKPVPGAHVYCCGPKRLMDDVRDMTGHWQASAIHFESFGGESKPRADDLPFEVRLNRSGSSIQVGAQQSILDALRNVGIRVPSSCESGTCGSCKVGLLEGSADHRDLVLMPEEKNCQIMVCVSRSLNGETLVLDL